MPGTAPDGFPRPRGNYPARITEPGQRRETLVKFSSRPGVGGRVFGPQLPRTGFWQVTLPLSIIHAYRRIPCNVRGVWSMGSSTSHMAETAVAAGGGWA